MYPPQRRGEHYLKTWACSLLSSPLRSSELLLLSFPRLDHWEVRVYTHFPPILVWLLPSYNTENSAFEPAEECGLQSMDCFMFGIIMIPHFLRKISVWWPELSLAKICKNPNLKIWALGCSKSQRSRGLFSEFKCPNGQILPRKSTGINGREQVYLSDHPNLVCFLAVAFDALPRRRVSCGKVKPGGRSPQGTGLYLAPLNHGV